MRRAREADPAGITAHKSAGCTCGGFFWNYREGLEIKDTVLILDFGSQYSMLIARKVREARVYCEIVRHDISLEEVRERAPRGLILSGGPKSVYDDSAPRCDPRILSSGIPMLGICYGMQLMAMELGGKVERSPRREYGKAELIVDDSGGLFEGLERRLTCWMSHGDSVTELPPGFRAIAHTENTPFAAMRDGAGVRFGIQFHPEVVHTPRGREILANFLFKVAGCTPSWTPENFIEESIREIRARVGDRKAICALSGGVDSSTVAVLVHRAIGDSLMCIFVDNGLLRKGEPERVISTFRDNFGIPLVYVDATKEFLGALAGVSDPESKRKIIGHRFISIFEREAAGLGDVDFLAQGTLYPDVIESTARDTGPAARIKSHHNVGGLPEVMKLELIEPLRYLFKDEVRMVGKELGLPEEIIGRQPFPGPGLAVRIIGEVTEERLDILREADAIVEEEIRRAGLYDDLWQSFAVMPAIRSVGVMGDERTYSYPIVLRAVVSEDGMTADWARLPYELLARISNRIINEVSGVNRVVYDISSKPPSTIEWE